MLITDQRQPTKADEDRNEEGKDITTLSAQGQRQPTKADEDRNESRRGHHGATESQRQPTKADEDRNFGCPGDLIDAAAPASAHQG